MADFAQQILAQGMLMKQNLLPYFAQSLEGDVKPLEGRILILHT
jgi:hypothetical protein